MNKLERLVFKELNDAVFSARAKAITLKKGPTATAVPPRDMIEDIIQDLEKANDLLRAMDENHSALKS